MQIGAHIGRLSQQVTTTSPLVSTISDSSYKGSETPLQNRFDFAITSLGTLRAMFLHPVNIMQRQWGRRPVGIFPGAVALESRFHKG